MSLHSLPARWCLAETNPFFWATTNKQLSLYTNLLLGLLSHTGRMVFIYKRFLAVFWPIFSRENFLSEFFCMLPVRVKLLINLFLHASGFTCSPQLRERHRLARNTFSRGGASTPENTNTQTHLGVLPQKSKAYPRESAHLLKDIVGHSRATRNIHPGCFASAAELEMLSLEARCDGDSWVKLYRNTLPSECKNSLSYVRDASLRQL